MRHMTEDNITQAVIARHANASDARLRDVTTGLVQHLHAFARDVALTEDELAAGLDFLAEAAGADPAGARQLTLLADVLGLSMLVAATSHPRPAGCTPATVAGLHHAVGAPAVDAGADLSAGAEGEPCFVRGRVRALDGSVVAGALVEVWHADGSGRYGPAGDEAAPTRVRGRMHCDFDGRFHFRTVVPAAHPVAAGGPVVQLLERLGRHAWRPAHLHFRIAASGFEPLVTHVFRDGDRYLDSDAIFGVRESLVAEWVRHPPGATPDGARCDVAYHTLDFDFVLQRST